MEAPAESDPAPRRRRGWALGCTGSILVAAAVGGYAWKRRIETERFLEQMRKQREQTAYEAALFPARVVFQRGPATEDLSFPAAERDPARGEYATCPDDSEGRDLAEFHLLDAPDGDPGFADAGHPLLRRNLERLYEAEPGELFATRIVLAESGSGPWKFRTTLFPAPFGGAVTPAGLPPDLAAALEGRPAPESPALEKPVVDPRYGGGPVTGIRYHTPNGPRAKAQERAERDHRRATQRYDDRHHHFYLVEASGTFGGNRRIVLRRMGQVFGEATISGAEEIVKTMASGVRAGD